MEYDFFKLINAAESKVTLQNDGDAIEGRGLHDDTFTEVNDNVEDEINAEEVDQVFTDIENNMSLENPVEPENLVSISGCDDHLKSNESDHHIPADNDEDTTANILASVLARVVGTDDDTSLNNTVPHVSIIPKDEVPYSSTALMVVEERITTADVVAELIANLKMEVRQQKLEDNFLEAYSVRASFIDPVVVQPSTCETDEQQSVPSVEEIVEDKTTADPDVLNTPENHKTEAKSSGSAESSSVVDGEPKPYKAPETNHDEVESGFKIATKYFLKRVRELALS